MIVVEKEVKSKGKYSSNVIVVVVVVIFIVVIVIVVFNAIMQDGKQLLNLSGNH